MDKEMLIQISRVSDKAEEDEIQVELCNEDTCIRVALSMADFAEILTGHGKIPCKVRRWKTKGMKR